MKVSMLRPQLAMLSLVLCSCANLDSSQDRDLSGIAEPSECNGVPPLALPTRVVEARGHQLALSEVGDPLGTPVFYAHGNPGSRLELTLLDADARRHGYRLLSFDRPGIGGTPYITPYSLKDFADDTISVADQLGINRFGLIGWSSGGPPVISVSNYYPDRVLFVFALAGYTDFSRFPNAQQFMKDQGLPGAGLADKHPMLLDVLLWGMRRADLKRPDFYLHAVMEELPEPDRQLLADAGQACTFMRIQQEGLQQSMEGPTQDLQVQWQYWGFEMADVLVPVNVVMGDVDPFVPQAFGHHLAENLRDAKWHSIRGHGHLLPFSSEFREWLFSNTDDLSMREIVNPQ